MSGPSSEVAGLARAYVEAHAAHDAGAVGGLYVANGRHREIATGSSRTGRAEISVGLTSFLTAFPDASWAFGPIIATGLHAAVPYRLSGTLKARLGPFEPEGQRLDLEGLFLIEISATGIVETADYWDAATFGRQMRPATR